MRAAAGDRERITAGGTDCAWLLRCVKVPEACWRQVKRTRRGVSSREVKEGQSSNCSTKSDLRSHKFEKRSTLCPSLILREVCVDLSVLRP